MKKSASALLAMVLVIAAVALGGCSTWFADPLNDANKAISTANTRLKAFGVSDAKSKELANELVAADLSAAGAAKALDIIAALRVELDKEKTELEAAKKAILTIKTLGVEQEYKTYADLEAKAIDTRILIVAESKKLYEEMDKMYTAIRDNKTNNTTTQKISAAIDSIMNEVAALTDQASVESKAAEDYFAKKKLGGGK